MEESIDTHNIRQRVEDFSTIIDIICCPKCEGKIVDNALDVFKCTSCQSEYNYDENIPSFFIPNDWQENKMDVTTDIRNFYEETPFPDYDNFESIESLVRKTQEGVFARLLNEQIPFGARILECGCGTGQLSNFLSVANRTVVGTDLCINSLKMASDFKIKCSLKNVKFLQMNLFKPCFRKENFDLVISNGVLHHTSDPFLGLKSISNLVRPGGYLLIGLYHQYGRMWTDFRRFVFNVTGNRLKFLDNRLQSSSKISQEKKNSWFNDQYKNPYESKHTINELMSWLNAIGFTFVKSIPKLSLTENFSPHEKLFKAYQPANIFLRYLMELSMLVTNFREGGFFIVIAKKK